MVQNFSELANFIWSAAELLPGDYRQAGYGKVIRLFGQKLNDESCAIGKADMLIKGQET